MLLSNRSGALLTLGDKLGALRDANEAASLAPPGFHTAYVRQVMTGLLWAQPAQLDFYCRCHVSLE